MIGALRSLASTVCAWAMLGVAYGPVAIAIVARVRVARLARRLARWGRS